MTGEKVIRARFAPSPTGYLHVGGARTALFNWLFCRRNGGKFILRIEDTDILRNIEGAEQKLIEDLRWLNIDYDEGPDIGGPLGPYRQSERRDLYDAAAKKLLDSGDAYYAFDTPEELEAMRREATAKKESFKYPRPDPLPTEADAGRARKEGRPVVVRFKTPNEPITVRDEILGDVTFGAGEIEDLVIVKSNGWPTYHFAVVVDDAGMQITHVLRAQEHLMNTPKHVFMQRALGYAPPRYAHLPLVFNIDGTKMSKRDKHKVVRTAAKNLIKQNKWTADDVARIAECKEASAKAWLDKADTELDMTQVGRLATSAGVEIPEIDVHDFRVSGYLSDALVNFIALIGWSPKDNREMLTRDEMIAAFSLEGINKTAGRFDRDKLKAMNKDYVASRKPEELVPPFVDWSVLNDSVMKNNSSGINSAVISSCFGFRTFQDIDEKAGVLFRPDDKVQYDPKSVKDVLEKKEGSGYAMLERLLPLLESLEPWSVERIDALVKEICEQTGAKTNDVAQPLRVALTGRTISPGIGETLALLGKTRTANRIRRCLQLRAGLSD